jgi:hypothetical protein
MDYNLWSKPHYHQSVLNTAVKKSDLSRHLRCSNFKGTLYWLVTLSLTQKLPHKCKFAEINWHDMTIHWNSWEALSDGTISCLIQPYSGEKSNFWFCSKKTVLNVLMEGIVYDVSVSTHGHNSTLNISTILRQTSSMLLSHGYHIKSKESTSVRSSWKKNRFRIKTPYDIKNIIWFTDPVQWAMMWGIPTALFRCQ